MLNGLRRFFRGIPKEAEYSDAVLGTLALQRNGRWWEAQVPIDGRVITFVIGGSEKPSAALVEHAREIVRDWGEFEARIAAFLGHEAVVQSVAAFEIRALQIESIQLPWPGRPDDGMIYFTGPSEDRVWRCDYVARLPKALGFDS